MKASVFTSILVAIFLFAINSSTVKAKSDAILYHNVETNENIVSTTYFKGNGNNENLIPFKKKVNTLNEQNLCVSKITYIWHPEENKWNPSDKIEYTYDGQNVVTTHHYAWNNKKQNWSEPKTVSHNGNESNTTNK